MLLVSFSSLFVQWLYVFGCLIPVPKLLIARFGVLRELIPRIEDYKTPVDFTYWVIFKICGGDRSWGGLKFSASCGF
jgi:hypothetical protein